MSPTTFILVTVLTGSAAGMPMRQAVELAGGIGEFINGVRSAFGRADEFAQQNGFDYSNVYNSLLQHTVMNTYLERQNSELIRTQLEETALLREQNSDGDFKQLLVQCIFLSLLTLCGIASIVIQLTQAHSRRRSRNDRDRDYE